MSIARNVFFAHVPKTGGRSLRLMLESVFDAREFPRLRVPADLDALSDSGVRQASILHGHFDYSHLSRVRRLTGSQWALATMVREPRQQVISHYRFVVRRPPHIWHQKFLGKSLGEALAIPITGQRLANGQTLYLNDVVGPTQAPLADIDPAEVLSVVDLVGDTTRLNIFYLRMCYHLRRAPSDQLARENVDPGRVSDQSEPMALTDDEETLLASMSFLDRQLYALGKERALREDSDFIDQLGLGAMGPDDFRDQAGFAAGVEAVRALIRQ